VFDPAACTLTRRSLLRVGAVGLTGLSLPSILRAESEHKTRKATAKSVIMLFQFGGASQHETFDPKPDAPAEIRGQFGSVRTKTPGLLVCEHLPKLAERTHLYSVVRTVHHRSSAHNSGAYYSLTGREPLINIVTANASATDFPHPGSIVDHLAPAEKVPTSVSLPTMIADGPFRTPGEFAGFLGKKHDPLWVLKDPNARDFKVNELALPSGVDVDRIHDRKAIQTGLAGLSDLAGRTAEIQGMQDYQARAIDLLASPRTQKAFAIEEEKPEIRDRYGHHTYGQSVLLARRLVEAGVRFVTVYYSRGIRGWDMHDNLFPVMKDRLLPHTDFAFSALLDDLKERGLLDETLVYWTGDFGRTPKINKEAGRDHWPQCQSIVMAGGGIQGGRTYGASDPTGAFPKDDPCRPDDITATVFHALGLDPETEIRDQLGRPMPISAGQPILTLF
jgi:hypothetical protein